MPAKSNAYWSGRAALGPGSTWYVDFWKDWYSKTIIKHAFRRVRSMLTTRSRGKERGRGKVAKRAKIF